MFTPLHAIKRAARHFPLADRRTAIRQGLRLIDAKRYLTWRGIEAIAVGSKFEYNRSTGSVL